MSGRVVDCSARLEQLFPKKRPRLQQLRWRLGNHVLVRVLFSHIPFSFKPPITRPALTRAFGVKDNNHGRSDRIGVDAAQAIRHRIFPHNRIGLDQFRHFRAGFHSILPVLARTVYSPLLGEVVCGSDRDQQHLSLRLLQYDGARDALERI